MHTDNKVNVLYLSYDGMTDPLGQSQVIPYLQGLAKGGYQFTLISFEKRKRYQDNGNYVRAILEASGINWQPLLFSSTPPFLSKLYDIWKMNRLAVKLYKKEKFLFVHCRSYVSAGTGLKLFKKFNV